jgi:hypothetical protein
LVPLKENMDKTSNDQRELETLIDNLEGKKDVKFKEGNERVILSWKKGTCYYINKDCRNESKKEEGKFEEFNDCIEVSPDDAENGEKYLEEEKDQNLDTNKSENKGINKDNSNIIDEKDKEIGRVHNNMKRTQEENHRLMQTNKALGENVMAQAI